MKTVDGAANVSPPKRLLDLLFLFSESESESLDELLLELELDESSELSSESLLESSPLLVSLRLFMSFFFSASAVADLAVVAAVLSEAVAEFFDLLRSLLAFWDVFLLDVFWFSSR